MSKSPRKLTTTPGVRSKDSNGDSPRRGRRIPADERKRELLEAALELFAMRGTGITIQSLADRVHVTQPLVHRYFPTKADLLESISRELREAHWDDAWHTLLTDKSRSLEQRITDFYESYLPHIFRAKWYRGFWYLALDNPCFAQAYLARVERDLLTTIIDEARVEYGFPAVKAVAAVKREIELVWGMHSTAIFYGIRRYVYEIPAWSDTDTIVHDQIRAYLLVVPEVMGELYAAGTPARRGDAARKRAAKN